MVITIFLVCPPELQMSIAFPSMIDLMPVGDLGKERPGIFGQWMKCKPIDNDANSLEVERRGSGRT